MIVLLDDRWSYFGAVAQIAPDGPKCPMIGHPVFQCRFCRILQKSVRIAVIEPAIRHISVFCVRNFIGGIDHIAPPVLRRSGQRKCPENVPLSIDALIAVGGGIRLQRVVGRPEGLPVPIVQNPAGDLSGGAPQLIRLVYRQSCMAAVPWKGGAVFQREWWKIIQPAGSPVSFIPTPVMHSGLEPLLRQKPPFWSNS